MTGGESITTVGLVHIYRSEGHDVAALAGVDLTVLAGEVVGLLGPSGAGKSTLLALIGGLFRPSAGKIFVGERELSALTASELDEFHARETSLLLQGARRNLIPYLTPRENVAFAQEAARRLGAEVPDPGHVLESVGLAEHGDTPLAHLSQGQLQLAALAVAMAPAPGVLLADEPTNALDHVARERILEAMLRINRQEGTTIVVVTHDPEVAGRLPRTVTIRDGRIGGEGRSGEEYAVVTADGFLPLPLHARADLPPGTLVRFDKVEDTYVLVPRPTGGSGEDAKPYQDEPYAASPAPQRPVAADRPAADRPAAERRSGERRSDADGRPAGKGPTGDGASPAYPAPAGPPPRPRRGGFWDDEEDEVSYRTERRPPAPPQEENTLAEEEDDW